MANQLQEQQFSVKADPLTRPRLEVPSTPKPQNELQRWVDIQTALGSWDQN